MTYILITYTLIGTVAGSMAGLLGIGGGSIIVPALSYAFIRQNIDENIAMHMAASTSLAIMVLTSQASVRTHQKHVQIDWTIYRKLVPGVILGVILGLLAATHLSGHMLKIIFAVFLICVAARMFGMEFGTSNKTTLPGKFGMTLAGVFIGGKSGLLGIGGGIITVPFLTHFQVSMRQAIALSAMISFTVASIGATINILEVHHFHHQWMTGYIYWPAVLCVAIPSIVFAKLGAKLSGKTPVKTLRKIFAFLLLLTAIELIFR